MLLPIEKVEKVCKRKNSWESEKMKSGKNSSYVSAGLRAWTIIAFKDNAKFFQKN